MDLKRRAELFSHIAAALIVAGFFWHLLLPVWDIDFWWHIAAGRWIVEHGQIPVTDPFGVFPNANPVRNDTVLRGQWAGQIALYEAFRNFGAYGVVVLRASLLSLCLALVYWRSRLLGAAPLAALLMLVVTGFGALGFSADRPQLLSFAFAALVLWLLDHREKTVGRWPGVLIPLVGLVWANSHGGVILGAALLLLYLALDLVAPLLGRQRGPRTGKLAWITALFVAATLVTPNGLTTYTYLFQLQGSALEKATSEYMSAFSIYQLGYWLPQFWVGAFFLLALTALPRLLRTDLRQVTLVVFLGVISVVAYRYFAFFLFLAAPYIAKGLPMPERIKSLPVGWSAASVAGLIWLLLGVVYPKTGLQQDAINQAKYPVSAVKYLNATGSAGRVFNHINWGGYLLWHAPKVQVFMDGRMLDDRRMTPYTHVLWATPQGRAWFDQAGFDLVLLPYRNPLTNEYYPVHDYLQGSGNWRVLYRWEAGALYGRNNGIVGERTFF